MAKFSSFYGRKIFHHMFIYFIFSFSIHTPVDISYLDLFNIWSLWMMLESTWGCIYTYRRVNSFPLNKYSKMELLDHMIALKKKKYLDHHPSCIPYWKYKFIFLPGINSITVFSFPNYWQHLLSLVSLVIAILTDVRFWSTFRWWLEMLSTFLWSRCLLWTLSIHVLWPFFFLLYFGHFKAKLFFVAELCNFLTPFE